MLIPSFSYGLALFIGFIPFFLCIFNRRKAERRIKPMLPFIYLIAVANVYETIGTNILAINSKYWFRIYLLLEFLAVYYFFKKELTGKLTTFFKVSLLVFCIAFLMILLPVFGLSADEGDACLSVLEYIFVAVCVFFWFKKALDNTKTFIVDDPLFYFVSGFVIYFSGTILLFVMSDFFYTNDAYNFKEFWKLNRIVNIVFRTLVLIGTWKALRK